MKIVWERFFSNTQDAVRYISSLPSQNLGGHAIYKLFRAKHNRVFVRCQRAKNHSLGH